MKSCYCAVANPKRRTVGLPIVAFSSNDTITVVQSRAAYGLGTHPRSALWVATPSHGTLARVDPDTNVGTAVLYELDGSVPCCMRVRSMFLVLKAQRTHHYWPRSPPTRVQSLRPDSRPFTVGKKFHHYACLPTP